MDQSRLMLDSPHKDQDVVKKFSRKDIRLLVQVVTGHCLLGGHLHRWRTTPSPCAKCGETRGTPSHLLLECPALEQQRRDLQQTHRSRKPYDGWLFFFKENTELNNSDIDIGSPLRQDDSDSGTSEGSDSADSDRRL